MCGLLERCSNGDNKDVMFEYGEAMAWVCGARV